MKKLLKDIYSHSERAAYTATSLGLHVNIELESYGGTPSVIVMAGDTILIHDTQSNVISWLSGIHAKVNAVLALLYACNADLHDLDCCMQHISETCAPTRLSEIYINFIFGNKALMRSISNE